MGIGRKKSFLEQAGETVVAATGTVVEAAGNMVGDVVDFVESTVTDVVESAKEAIAEDEPAPGKSGGKLKKALLLSAVVAVGGVLFKKVRGAKNAQSDNWQASYVPKPPPAAKETAGKESVAKVEEKATKGAEKVAEKATKAADAVEEKTIDLADKAKEKAAKAADAAQEAADDAKS